MKGDADTASPFAMLSYGVRKLGVPELTMISRTVGPAIRTRAPATVAPTSCPPSGCGPSHVVGLGAKMKVT